MQAHCQLQDHLHMLRKVFFMESGHHMYLFTSAMFENLDRGQRVNNQVILNGHLHESLEGINKAKRSSSTHGKKPLDPQRVQVRFKDEPAKYPLDALHSLDYVSFNFSVSAFPFVQICFLPSSGL
jgi:hypothetical protein